MKALRTIATGLGATMLATTMLAGAANAAPKPQIKFNTPMALPKANIIKPIRPNVARPQVRVRVNRDRLQPKAGQDDDPAGNDVPPSARQSGKAVIATLTPPSRLPQPRPEFEDRAGDIADIAGADGIGDINPDDLRVATNPHDPDGALGGLLPGAGEEEQQAGSGPSGPFGRLGGDDNMWNDARGGMGSTIPNPAGDNSHGKDAPETAPGVRVTPGSIAAAMGAVAGKDDKDPSAGKQEGSTGSKQPGLADPGGSREYDSDDGSSHIVETYRREGDDFIIVRSIENDAGTNVLVRTLHGDGSRTDYYRFASGWGWTQERDADGHAGPIRYFGVAELRNPDDAGGGGYVPPNCGSVECNESRKGGPGLRLSDGMVRALTDPEHSAAAARNAVAPIVTQHDLLSQYDPDFTGGGGPTPIDKQRIQSD